jgi:hypothetical protein
MIHFFGIIVIFAGITTTTSSEEQEGCQYCDGGRICTVEHVNGVLNGNTVIGPDFYEDLGCSNKSALRSITIPRSVTKIEEEAFEKLNWLSILKFEEGSQLTHIGADAFAKTLLGFSLISKKNTLTLPASVESIGKDAFDGTQYYELAFEPGSDLTSLPESIGEDNDLYSIVFNDAQHLQRVGSCSDFSGFSACSNGYQCYYGDSYDDGYYYGYGYSTTTYSPYNTYNDYYGYTTGYDPYYGGYGGPTDYPYDTTYDYDYYGTTGTTYDPEDSADYYVDSESYYDSYYGATTEATTTRSYYDEYYYHPSQVASRAESNAAGSTTQENYYYYGTTTGPSTTRSNWYHDKICYSENPLDISFVDKR